MPQHGIVMVPNCAGCHILKVFGYHRSTVRRHPRQNAFLKAVGTQTRIIRLQGFLFFGTISSCEAEIRQLLDHAAWTSTPIRFLVLDFTLASGESTRGLIRAILLL